MKCMVLNYKREKEQYPPGFGMMTRLQCLNAKLSVLSDSRKQLNYLCPKCWPHNDLYNIMFWPNSHTYRQMTRGSEWYIRDDQYFFGQVPLSYKYGNLSLKSLHFIILGFPELSYERGLCTRYSFCTKVSSCRYAQGLFSHLLQWEVILHLVRWSPNCKDCIYIPPLLYFLHIALITTWMIYIFLFIDCLPPPLEGQEVFTIAMLYSQPQEDAWHIVSMQYIFARWKWVNVVSSPFPYFLVTFPKHKSNHVTPMLINFQ